MTDTTRAQTVLQLQPSLLMQAFYVPAVEVDCGDAPDYVDTACKAYLLWEIEYPDHEPRLVIEGRPIESALLTKALWGDRR